MDNKKNIYNKTIKHLKKKNLTSLELEKLLDKLFIKLNNLSDIELLELDTLNFIVTLENNDINLNIINKHDAEIIDNIDKLQTTNEGKQKMIDLLNYRTKLLQDLQESISDLDNFNTIKKIVLQTPLQKIKDFNFNFNTVNNTEIHNFITKVKCDIINDTKFNYNKFREKVFNDIDTIPIYVIQNINKDPILYNNLLNNIKLKYFLLQFIYELITNKKNYKDNIELYNNHYNDIEKLINKLSIDKINIVKKNLNYIPNSISLDHFIVDLNNFINNLLLENNVDKLHKFTLYEKPKSQLNYSDPIDIMLGQDNLKFKQKCILAAVKFQQELSSKMKVVEQSKANKVYTHKSNKVYTHKSNKVYTPIQKVAVQTIQHYFPDLININYKDNLNENIFYGTLTGDSKQDNIKKWKNF